MRDIMCMVELQELCLTLAGPQEKEVPILYQVNLEVYKEEYVSIVGPSGSGKTSLLMVIAGVEQASSGKVLVAGQDITSLDEEQLAAFRRRYVSLVLQNFHLIPTITALDNVMLALEISGFDCVRDRAMASLQQVGLEKRFHHLPAQLSGGEQQRVALSRAFAVQPKLLLADEPTGNLDSENGKRIIDLLIQLKEHTQSTVLLITHDKHLAAQASRQLRMEDGRLYEQS